MYLLLIQPNTFILGDLCTRVLHSLALICTCSHLEFQRMSILVFSFITVLYLYLLLFISYFLVPMASLFRFYSFCWMVCVCVCVSHSVMANSLQPHGLQSARLLWPWNSPGKNTGVSCHFLLQEIFPTQGPNLGLCIIGRFFTVRATRG